LKEKTPHQSCLECAALVASQQLRDMLCSLRGERAILAVAMVTDVMLGHGQEVGDRELCKRIHLL